MASPTQSNARNPRAETVTFLKTRVPLLADFPEERLGELVDGSRTLSFEPNEAVVHFGDDPTFLGVILDGKLATSVIAEGGQRQVLDQLETGSTFGELALMTGDKMMADVIAESRCRILLIPITLFQSVIVTQPRALQHISRTMAERLRQVLQEPEKAAAAVRQSADPYGLHLHGERPEKILALNCGSSSVRYAFFDTENEQSHAYGLIERIGASGTRLVHHGPKGEDTRELPGAGYHEAFQVMLEVLTAKETGVLGGLSELSLVGHRVVHGGERFTEATLISDEVLGQIEQLNPLAPLHNPVNVAGIREMRRLCPAVPHVAVFDTAFHHTLPSYAYLYGLPYDCYEKKGIRRYGFHGTSHAYVCLRAAQHLKQLPNALEIVSCHLGNGSSICAVDHGRSVDTSMGFTPGEGLIMGTRCGDLDPGIVTFLQRSEGLTSAQLEDLLNKQSGLLGLSGISSDMREIEQAAEAGNTRALLALKAYCYRVRKYIGAYVAAMEGLDVIVFTGGIGQGSAGVRTLALQGLACMGIRLDEKRNREARGFDEICRISSDDSRVTVLVVPTDEARMIAREALRALGRSYIARILETQRKEPIPLEVSAHHVHLTQEHVEALFGHGHQLTRQSDLSQPGQFACEEQVTLVGPKGRIERVRVLGPVRSATQVEIAMTEQFKLGIHPPIRQSGDLKDTPGVTLEGPAGCLTLQAGVICALRHIHMTPQDALRYGLRDKSVVRVRVTGDRELIFGDVLVRVDPNFSLAMHIDTDEANASHIQTGAQGYIDGLQSQD